MWERWFKTNFTSCYIQIFIDWVAAGHADSLNDDDRTKQRFNATVRAAAVDLAIRQSFNLIGFLASN